MKHHVTLAFIEALVLAACAPVDPPGQAGIGRSEICVASVFDEGAHLADGSRWSRERSRSEVLVAHKRLPLGSRVRITRLDTGASIVAPVRGRGPYVARRCVGLSSATASRLGFSGLARVRVDVVP